MSNQEEEFVFNENEEIYKGHFDLVDIDKLMKLNVFMLGAGSIGSFAAVAMAKMGITKCTIVDFDSIEVHNQANQIYNWRQTGALKVAELEKIISGYSKPNWEWEFHKDRLESVDDVDKYARKADIIISAVDNMKARQLLFEYSCQNMARISMFIDSRIGATQCEAYAVLPYMPDEVQLFEENNLDNDEDMPDIKCTEKSIIFPVMWTASWISSCIYHIANGTEETIPFGIDINFKTWDIFKDKRP